MISVKLISAAIGRGREKMEELQSTELLDREILEDARKKALRILKSADDTVKAKTAEWEDKTRAAMEQLGVKYAEQRVSSAAEIMARLPMDKRRARAEKIESLLRRGVEAWYSRLSREQVLSLLEKELAKRLALCPAFSGPAGEYRARVMSLGVSEAEDILGRVLPGTVCPIEEQKTSGPYPEIVLENSAVRITSSVQKTVDFFLLEKRAELVRALLGEENMGEEGF
jgi:hypothetical protein